MAIAQTWNMEESETNRIKKNIENPYGIWTLSRRTQTNLALMACHGQASTAVNFGPGSGTEAPGLPGAMHGQGSAWPVLCVPASSDVSECQRFLSLSIAVMAVRHVMVPDSTAQSVPNCSANSSHTTQSYAFGLATCPCSWWHALKITHNMWPNVHRARIPFSNKHAKRIEEHDSARQHTMNLQPYWVSPSWLYFALLRRILLVQETPPHPLHPNQA